MQNGGLYVPNTIARVFIVHSSPDGAIGGYNIEKICGCERRGLQRAHLVCSRTPLYSCDSVVQCLQATGFLLDLHHVEGSEKEAARKKGYSSSTGFFCC